MKYTKAKFREMWDSDDNGGGITWDDVADCAKAWGLYSAPMIHPMHEVLMAVCEAAKCKT
jgi:hypothetical protein